MTREDRLGIEDSLAVVPPPESTISRIERRDVDPFSAVDWQFANGGTFNGRFDDPTRWDGTGSDERFRMIYATSNPAGCFAESIAQFRLPPGLRGQLDVALDESNDREPVRANGGTVRASWRADRQIRTTVLARHLRFADLWDAASLNYLREALTPLLLALGFSDLDLGSMSGATPESRQFTRACAQHVYELTDRRGQPAFAGIRYRSRWGDQWECWAVYSDRLVHAPGSSPSFRGISESEPGLLAAAEVFGLRIEPDRLA